MAAWEVKTSPKWVTMILNNLEGLVLMILIPRLRVLFPNQLGSLLVKKKIKRKSILWTSLTQFQAVIQTRIVTTLKSLERRKRDRRSLRTRRLNRTDRRKPQKRLLHLQLEAQEWHQNPKMLELSTPMSQLHNSNKLQLPLNQKMTINSLTSSALRNPLNNSPPHSGL